MKICRPEFTIVIRRGNLSSVLVPKYGSIACNDLTESNAFVAV